MKILLYEPTYRRIKNELHEIAPNVQPILMDQRGRLHENGAEISVDDIAPEIAWPNSEVYMEGPVREYMIAVLKSRSLKWVQTSSAGVEHPVFAAIVNNGSVLTNSDAGGIAIAEFVVSSVLDVYQPFAARREAQTKREWSRFRFREISGTQWMIVGFGNIGQAVGVRARAFGANIIGVRRSAVDCDFATVIRPAEMYDHLPDTDVVVVAAALNPDTHHIISTDFLSAMKPDSVLVNIGRGGHVDEAALLDSLDRGIPGTAVLDVFDEEPLPPESPFWSHPRVRLTPHNAASSDGVVHRNDRVFLDNLRRYVNGQPLNRIVDAHMLAQNTDGVEQDLGALPRAEEAP